MQFQPLSSFILLLFSAQVVPHKIWEPNTVYPGYLLRHSGDRLHPTFHASFQITSNVSFHHSSFAPSHHTSEAQNNTLFDQVSDIPLPPGYHRIETVTGAFGSWLRQIKLKEDKTVYLFNGQKKSNQSAQFAVLDIPVGKKDLQQCADAVMRLRASYLLSIGKSELISFSDNNSRRYDCPRDPTPDEFERYLEDVYAHCSTASLEKQLKRVEGISEVMPGDVLIKGGSPGHAVLVMDVAINGAGRRIFTIAQSYMPAQSIHLLKNPANSRISPWYYADDNVPEIETPEWTFYPGQLRRWQ